MNAEISNKQATDKLISVRIRTPDSLVWEGKALTISSENSTGRFDILPQHANMITIIEGQLIEVSTNAGTRKFSFEKAVIAVRDGAVHIYANILKEKNK